MTVQVFNDFSGTCPVDVDKLRELAAAVFINCEDVNKCISKYLAALTEMPEFQNFKLVLQVSEFDAKSSGPLKTFSGSYWNATKDGTYCFRLGETPFLVQLTWISE